MRTLIKRTYNFFNNKLNLDHINRNIINSNLVKRIISVWRKPIIIRSRSKTILNKKFIFVFIVSWHFNQKIPKAPTKIINGYINALDKMNIPYIIIGTTSIDLILKKIPNPLCFISGSDYRFLTKENLETLRKYKHFVWVNHWFKNSIDFYKKHNLPNISWSNSYCEKILSAKPNFVFTPGTKSTLQYYEKWEDNGQKLISLPLACDTSLYHPNIPLRKKFEKMEIVFVGGYWSFKARQFNKYLKPFEKKLSVFGYSKWPYIHYGGKLPDDHEPSLYKQALLCPAINEPYAEIFGGDICERVFKIMGCEGLPITDCVPAHYDIFSKNELIVPRDLNDYKEKVRKILEDNKLFEKYRKAGYKAILERHTYVHRVKTILKNLGIEHLINSGNK
ncbi:MAG: glycosyltransferase [Candidatus Helarchaeota archaeon]|nr:glycosyltransferase [Candidatus Helarchaeota archaeon]